MGSRTSPKKIGEVLQSFIRSSGLEAGIDEAAAVEGWKEMAGQHVMQVVDRVWMERGVLHVKVRSATWRQELHLQREMWKDRLNEKLGKLVVREIRFR